MFSREINGYKKSDVDSFIQRMKASYEAKLMEEKLKALDSERKVLDMKNERFDIENKEKNIMTALNAIEKAKRFQEEGSRKFYRLIMEKLELLIKELDIKFPQLRKNQNFESLLSEFSEMINNYKASLEERINITQPVYSENDSMRLLLNKMQDYKKTNEAPKEVHISIKKKAPDLRAIPEKESGFNLEEALHPTEDLEEIMKAFDFYNED